MSMTQLANTYDKTRIGLEEFVSTFYSMDTITTTISAISIPAIIQPEMKKWQYVFYQKSAGMTFTLLYFEIVSVLSRGIKKKC